MKRFLTFFAACALGVVLVACGSNNNDNNQNENDQNQDLVWDYDTDEDYDFDFDLDGGFGWYNPLGNPDPALSALMAQLYEGVEAPMVENWELTQENFSNFIFIDYIPDSVGIMSQAMINVIPHLMVLLEVPAGMDAAAVAADIEANADPARWICVMAEALGVFSHGQYVIMVMSDQSVVDGIHANIATVLN